jgi:hypothetical protein
MFGGGNPFFLYIIFFIINFIIELVTGQLTPTTTA